MTKQFFFFLFIILNGISNAQNSGKYVDIPRSKISIIPPEGFRLSKDFIGFRSIKTRDVFPFTLREREIGYSESVKKFFEKVKNDSVDVHMKETCVINGYPATIISLTLTGDRTMYVLFGDSTFTVTVGSGLVDKDGNTMDSNKELKKSFQSIRYNKNKVVNYYETPNFSVDTINTVFKFSRFAEDPGINDYLFSPNGKYSEGDSQFIRIIEYDAFEKISIEEEFESDYNDIVKRTGGYGHIKNSNTKYQKDGVEIIFSDGDFYMGITRMYFCLQVLKKENYHLTLIGMCKYQDEKLKAEILNFFKLAKIK